MILTDKKILEEIDKGNITIKPFVRDSLGTNSYDVHLGRYLGIYEEDVLDAKVHNKIKIIEIPGDGIIIVPNRLYLGVTKEYTETLRHVPFLEGKSSIGRLGIDIHATAGKGDVGYKNTWTLEISVKQPVRIYADMPIGQLIYFEISGTVGIDYAKKQSSKYTDISIYPVESKMYLNFR
jgi:dCTP deaminase